jgi:hypothetical protein
LPARLIEHGWAKLADRRQETSDRINNLIIRLRNVLKVDELKNGKSRTPQKLKTTLGKRYKEAFDFERMAELLEDSTPHNRLPVARRDRIRAALTVLESQKFFASGAVDPRDKTVHHFMFDKLSTALKAYNQRVSEMVDVIRAMTIAELELDNAYCEDKHSTFFERFGSQSLSADDLGLFPPYLVCLHESECDTRDLAHLMEIVTSELPMKVLIQVSDPLGDLPSMDGHRRRSLFMQQLVHTFVAGDTYVLQSSASHLYRQKEHIQKALEFAGPAIFSVFVPFADSCQQLPAYLICAAAMESRVFPAFSYNPAAGAGLLDRFDIRCNPDVNADWPRRELRFEDEQLQAVIEEVAFTPADFAATDLSSSGHFALAAKDSWNEGLVAVADYVDREDINAVDAVPSIAVVGRDNVLQRLVVDEGMIRSVRRYRERWHALQELGGVHNSYADAARQTAEAEFTQAESVPKVDVEVSQPVAEEVVQPLADADTDSDTDSDETANDAYIETPRCTTCDECTDKNDRLFAYDDNKQAYIKDLDAGSYRDLVDAAEICQVAIIHPGMPRNPDEPGLDELIERAEPFNND